MSDTVKLKDEKTIRDDLKKQRLEQEYTTGYADGYTRGMQESISASKVQPPPVESMFAAVNEMKLAADICSKVWNSQQQQEQHERNKTRITNSIKSKTALTNLTHNGKSTIYVILAIDNLPSAAQLFERPERLVQGWMEAIHSGDVEEFYDNLLELEPVSTSNAEHNLKPRTYDETCIAATAAIECIYRSLLLNYNISRIKNAFANNRIQRVVRIDHTSILMVMVPK